MMLHINTTNRVHHLLLAHIFQMKLKMSVKILFVGLFLLAVCRCIHSSAAHYPTGKNRPCCFSVTRNDLSSKVVGTFFYDIPARRPCVRAVIFNTEKGPICVDHNEQWVKNLIESLKKKK